MVVVEIVVVSERLRLAHQHLNHHLMIEFVVVVEQGVKEWRRDESFVVITKN
ncbi:hypothetical protein D3C80_2084140 [compost metagenome]